MKYSIHIIIILVSLALGFYLGKRSSQKEFDDGAFESVGNNSKTVVATVETPDENIEIEELHRGLLAKENEISVLKQAIEDLNAQLANAEMPEFVFDSSPTAMGEQAGKVKSESLAFYEKYYGQLPAEDSDAFTQFISDLDNLLLWNITQAAITELKFGHMNSEEKATWATSLVSEAISLSPSQHNAIESLFMTAYKDGRIRFDERGKVSDPRAKVLEEEVSKILEPSQLQAYRKVIGPLWLPNNDILVVYDSEGNNMAHWLYETYGKNISTTSR